MLDPFYSSVLPTFFSQNVQASNYGTYGSPNYGNYGFSNYGNDASASTTVTPSDDADKLSGSACCKSEHSAILCFFIKMFGWPINVDC
jgi:hypothetical protein